MAMPKPRRIPPRDRNSARSCARANSTREIEIEVAAPAAQMEILAPPGMEELTSQIQGMFQNLGGGKRKTRAR
jgi:ATP-dependent protease HslVU (ClpYQ) ATPase subunit